MKTIVKKAYQIFLRKLWGRSDFFYQPNERSEKCVDNFIKLLDKEYGLESIGTSFIYDYFCFQLDYWNNLNTRFGKKIPIEWFIGKKAFKRWKENEQRDLWHAHKLAREYGLHVGMLEAESVPKPDMTVLRESEEVEKARFYGEDQGLVNCLEYTTLYNHRSQHCIGCKFRRECKILLKENYYGIWIKRGYNEKNTSKVRKRV